VESINGAGTHEPIGHASYRGPQEGILIIVFDSKTKLW
jgi:hypothetical protein